MHFSCGIVRPPYEAGSCFLQVTSGCSHNKCRFCTFYKEAPFSVSPESEIREDQGFWMEGKEDIFAGSRPVFVEL